MAVHLDARVIRMYAFSDLCFFGCALFRMSIDADVFDFVHPQLRICFDSAVRAKEHTRSNLQKASLIYAFVQYVIGTMTHTFLVFGYCIGSHIGRNHSSRYLIVDIGMCATTFN